MGSGANNRASRKTTGCYFKNFAELFAAVPFPVPFIIVNDLCCIGARPTACRCTTKANPQGMLDDPEGSEIALLSDDQAA